MQPFATVFKGQDPVTFMVYLSQESIDKFLWNSKYFPFLALFPLICVNEWNLFNLFFLPADFLVHASPFLFLCGLPLPEWIISFCSSHMDVFPLNLIFLGQYAPVLLRGNTIVIATHKLLLRNFEFQLQWKFNCQF